MLSITIIDYSLDIHTHLDPLSRRSPPHHRLRKDVLLFRAEEQATWDRMLLRRHPPRLSQVSSHRRVRGDIRVSRSFWVRMRFSGRVSVLPPPYLFCRSHSSSYDTSELQVTAPHNFL
jgi:hypothetical protein